jgi:membrane protease YdiL (CAAX protease family)
MKIPKRIGGLPHHRQASRLVRLALYYLLACLIAWGIWIPADLSGRSSPLLFLLAGFGPSLSGVLFLFLERGRNGVHDLWVRLIDWKMEVRWYGIAILGPALVLSIAIIIVWTFQNTLPRIVDPAHIVRAPGQWGLGFLVFTYIFFTSALGEETGWRGYALPRLINDFGKVRAGIIVGIAWGLWHLPLFWLPGNFHQQLPLTWFLLQSLVSSLLYTWLYSHTNGSLLLAMLFHAGGNAAVGLLPVLPADTGGSAASLWAALVLQIVITACVLRFDPILHQPDENSI